MKIVLATLHAKYIHASLALPCLQASLQDSAGIELVIREFTVNEPRADVLRSLVAEQADVIAFSCYIWNIDAVTRLAADLRLLLPDTFLAAGGPEVSYSAEAFLEDNPAFACVIRGEGEATWAELVTVLQATGKTSVPLETMPAGITCRSGEAIVRAPDRQPICNLDDIPSPFALGLVDLGKQLVYYETSRGCPFSCAFCLSSMEQGVRSFSSGRIRRDLEILIEHEVTIVKLVDRTFNYDAERADEIWDFILTRNRKSRFHFEIAADLLTEQNLQTLRRIPEDTFRFEIGVQATGAETLERVGRKSDTGRLFAAVEQLVRETGVTVHLDLVAGLPGEDFAGFLTSLQQLFAVHPHHIQVELLKVLKGSPMAEIAAREGYAFSTTAPYTVLRTPDLSFGEICCIEDISRLIDHYYNSGRFRQSLARMEQFVPLSDFFVELARYSAEEPMPGKVSPKGLFEYLWRFVGTFLDCTARESFRDALCYDYCLGEYPSAGLTPSFFPEDWKSAGNAVPRETIQRILDTMGHQPGSRVRTFSGLFARDYSLNPGGKGPARIVFVYVSAPGSGLQVSVNRVETC